MNGLDKRAIVKAGVVRTLLGRGIAENAYIEINNQISEHSIRSLPLAFVDRILADYRIEWSTAKPRLLGMYASVLKHFLEDKQISDEELEQLRHLRLCLGISDSDLKRIESHCAGAVYKNELSEALANQHISDAERQELKDLARRLRIPEETEKELYKEGTQVLVQKVFGHVIGDRRLSPDEEELLRKLAKNIGGELEYDSTSLSLLERYRLLWRLEQGELPQLQVPIRLQKGEVCHLHTIASLHEFRRVTTGVRYSGPSASIRICKGVRWRLGQVSLQRISHDELQMLDAGQLYITNKRLIFAGTAKNTTITFSRMTSFDADSDGFRIHKTTGKHQYFKCEGDIEVVGAILTGALNQPLN